MSNENFEFCLSSNCLKDLPLDKYEKNFTFVVGEKRYQTNRVIADILSPLIRKLHYTDPTISEFIIDMKTMNTNSNENDYFTEFLSLLNFEKLTIEPNRQKFYLHYFCKLANIDEYFRLQPDYLETIDIENVLDRLQSFVKMNVEYIEFSKCKYDFLLY